MSTLQVNRFENTSGVAYGTVLQVVNTTSTSYSSSATVMPTDDTVPTSTEGFEILSASITPKSATNKLKITVSANLSTSQAGGVGVAMALFQDSGTNAIASSISVISTVGYVLTIPLVYYMTAGTTSSTTFKVRAGCNSGSTYVNGNNTSRLLGGTAVSSITIEEIQV
jgi:hypothetical protein